MTMTMTRDPRSSIETEFRSETPLEETSYAVWTHTTMLDDDTVDGGPETTVLRGID